MSYTPANPPTTDPALARYLVDELRRIANELAAISRQPASATEWGEITGDIQAQSDLVAILDDLQAQIDTKAPIATTVTTNTNQVITGRKTINNVLRMQNIDGGSRYFDIRVADFGAINSLGVSSTVNNANILLTATSSGGTDQTVAINPDGQVLLPGVVTSNTAAATKAYADAP